MMSPPGQSLLEHYTTPGQALRGLLDYKILLNSIVKMLGSLSYLIVSSVGIIALAFVYYFTLLLSAFKNKRKTSTLELKEIITLTYPILTTLCAIAVGSIMFATTNQNNIVHWIYGRYVEPTIIPLLAIGF